MTLSRRTATPRGAFTLVELLVVIAIIALLMGLLLPVLSRVRIQAKETEAVAQMRQIDQAVTNFTTKMRVEYIPAFGSGTNGAFRVRPTYTSATNPSDSSIEAVYLKQVFPYINLSATGLPTADYDPNQTLTLFLTGGDVTKHQGFSNNKQQPFAAPTTNGETRIGPFLETKPGDFDSTNTRLIDKFGTPFAYFSSISGVSGQFRGDYANGSYTQSYNNINGQSALTVRAPLNTGGTPVKYLNAKSHQIISAGANKQFGQGGLLTPGQGDYAPNGVGYDDFSTVQKSRLGESD